MHGELPQRRAQPRFSFSRFRQRLALAALLLAAAGFGGAAHAQTLVPSNWPMKPAGLSAGDQFRLMFVTKEKFYGSSNVSRGDIADWNWKRAAWQASRGHRQLARFYNKFKAVVCTETADAKDNTYTTYTSASKGVPIYWAGGAKVADNYEDFWDGDWDSNAPRDQDGALIPHGAHGYRGRVWTGCTSDGTGDDGNEIGRVGNIATGNAFTAGKEVDAGLTAGHAVRRSIYALSAKFQVTNTEADFTPPVFDDAVVDRTRLVVVFRDLPSSSLHRVRAGENLDNSAFEVKKTSAAGVTSTVALTGEPEIEFGQLVLTLASPVLQTDRDVTVLYTKPSSGTDNKLIDLFYNEVETFDSPKPVSNYSLPRPLRSVNKMIFLNEGASKTIGVWLDRAPDPALSPVTVTVTSGDDTAVSVSGGPLTFTTANWSTRQDVVVTAIHDSDTDSERTEVRFSGANLLATTTDIQLTDRNAPGLVVSQSPSLGVGEGVVGVPAGSSTRVSVKLSSQPTRDVTLTVTCPDTYLGIQTPRNRPLTFTRRNWNRPQTVTLTDRRTTPEELQADFSSVRFSAESADSAFDGANLERGMFWVAKFLGPVAASFDAEGYAVHEGGNVEVTVRLDRDAQRGPIVVPISAVAGGTASADDYTLSTTSVTFGADEVEKTVRLTATTTAAAESDETVTLELGTPTDPAGSATVGSPSQTAVTITETEKTLVSFEPGGAHTGIGIPEGSQRTIKVKLSKAATAALAVPLATTLTGGAAAADYTLSASSLDFAIGDTEKEVTVTAASDADDDAGEGLVLRLGTLPAGLVAGTPQSAHVAFLAPGTAEISVADASVAEAAGATLGFAVTLAQASTAEVTVDYATSDGTATAGADYTTTSGTLTFAAGETSKTVSVPVLDDNVDEGSETMTLMLSNPSSNATIVDGTATGTITNSDPIPKAWMARFGRTVTDQVIDAVEARVTGQRKAGGKMNLAGQTVKLWDPSADVRDEDAKRAALADAEERRALEAIAAWMRHAGDPGARNELRTSTGRELLTGMSFSMTGGGEDRGYASFWGRGAVSGFDGRDGGTSVDGDVTTGLIGADWTGPRWTGGLALGHSIGTGGYRSESGKGDVEATLTGIYPYAGMSVSERLSLWAAAGWGSGEITVKPDGGARKMSADMTMSMGAAGMRSELIGQARAGEGVSLAFKGSARLTRTSSESVPGMRSADAETWRLSAGLEGSSRMDTGDGGSLTPSLEVGVRQDGGDAETGTGADLGGGIAFADPGSGISLDARGRTLVAHSDDDFREWGASLGGGWDARDRSGRGPKASLTQSWGADPSGGMDSLLDRETMAGLAGNGDLGAQRRLEGELGYGMSAFGGGFTGTPNMGFGISGTGGRDWRAGWRLTPARGGFELDLDATRTEAANDDTPPEHALTLRASMRW